MPVNVTTEEGHALILHHQVEAKLDNKARLKQVKNLEELVKFKVSTVADRIAEHAHGDSNEYLNQLRNETDPLLKNYLKPKRRGPS